MLECSFFILLKLCFLLFFFFVGLPSREFTDEELFKFKEVFSMIDIEHIGYLGRRNFTDLLDILMIEVSDDVMEKMFVEMDENGDGQIEFDGERPTLN